MVTTATIGGDYYDLWAVVYQNLLKTESSRCARLDNPIPLCCLNTLNIHKNLYALPVYNASSKTYSVGHTCGIRLYHETKNGHCSMPPEDQWNHTRWCTRFISIDSGYVCCRFTCTDSLGNMCTVGYMNILNPRLWEAVENPMEGVQTLFSFQSSCDLGAKVTLANGSVACKQS